MKWAVRHDRKKPYPLNSEVLKSKQTYSQGNRNTMVENFFL